jgi:DNA (cytosine-5)-methyltransferase 1
VDSRPINMLSLFAGVAGLELGLKLACPTARTVCYAEHEGYACEVLASRMQDKTLADAPIWTDIRTFDGRPWRGLVDAIIGGFPCQDISCAGRGEGIEGKRSGLWSEMVRIIREVRPGFVFVENVRALLNRGIDRVLADLADLGFDAQWTVLSAKACGATHKRERVFVLAHAEQQQGSKRRDADEKRRRQGQTEQVGVGCDDVADPQNNGSCCTEWRQEGRTAAGWTGKTVGNPSLPLFPPGPDDTDAWRYVLERWPWLAPAMGDAESIKGQHKPKDVGNGKNRKSGDVSRQTGSDRQKTPEPKFCDMASRSSPWLGAGLYRADQLRVLGNLVNPIQAAAAFTMLARRAGLDAATLAAEHELTR